MCQHTLLQSPFGLLMHFVISNGTLINVHLDASILKMPFESLQLFPSHASLRNQRNSSTLVSCWLYIFFLDSLMSNWRLLLWQWLSSTWTGLIWKHMSQNPFPYIYWACTEWKKERCEIWQVNERVAFCHHSSVFTFGANMLILLCEESSQSWAG